MDDKLLEALLAAPDDEALQALIEAHALDVEAVETLKAHSARFYFDRPAEAMRVAEIAHRLGNMLPDPAPALGRWTLANALLFTDHHLEAVELFDRAHTSYLVQSRSLDAARMGVGHVWALAYTGQFERALALAAEIEPVLAAAAQTDSADHRRLGGLFNNVGITHDLLGQYEEALAAYDHKLEIAQALGNALDAARTQHNRACALTYLNAFDEALAAFREAKAGFLEAQATADLARLTYKRGALYARWGRYTEAESEFAASSKWLAGLQDAGPTHAALTVYRLLARMRSGTAPDEALISELTAAQATLAASNLLFNEGLAWLALGRSYLALDNLPSAQHAFGQTLALAEQGGGHPLAWEALHNLGNLAEQRDDPAAAIEFYTQAITDIEAMRRDLHVETFRAGFLTDKLVVYQDLALLYVRLDRLEDAFAIVERAKSRLLAERLNGRLDDEITVLAASDDPPTQATARRLRDILARLEKLYRQARLDEAGERGEMWSVAPAPDTLVEVKRLEAEVLDLARGMERDQPVLSPLAVGRTVPLQTVQANLRDTLLLQYYIAREQVGVFVVDSAGIQTYQELAPLSKIETARRRFSAAVERVLGLTARYGQEMLTRYLPPLLADAQAQLASLYDYLIRPLTDYLLPERPLVVLPDGSMHYVPFHALYDGASYLIERHVVSYTPSATVLDLCARHIPQGQGMLVMGYGGDHLTQIMAEIQTLTRLFPEADILSEAEATTERLLADAPHYRLLHLAAHACFRADNAMLSSLSLADRRLALAEIARLRLDVDLVTLSGCETGRGRLYGADLISLACGFLGAGARSLLVSMWRVDDAITAQLMDAFYQALRGGEGRAVALRTAQLELLARGYHHPAHWAPFILLGEWGTVL